MVDPGPYLPVRFDFPPDADRNTSTRLALLRLGDDLPWARAQGFRVAATLVVNVRPLKPGEQLQVFINGQGPVTLTGEEAKTDATVAPVDLRKQPRKSFEFDRDWWRRGEHRLRTDATWWRLGANTLRFVYRCETPTHQAPPAITWVDLLIDYSGPGA